jgi:hypothetical protein
MKMYACFYFIFVQNKTHENTVHRPPWQIILG